MLFIKTLRGGVTPSNHTPTTLELKIGAIWICTKKQSLLKEVF